MIAGGFVRRSVTRLPERVEKICGFLRNDAFIGEPPKRLLKRLPLTDIEGVVGSNRVGQKLGKLAQLKNRGARIIAEVIPSPAD
jgi:hypothetical protein